MTLAVDGYPKMPDMTCMTIQSVFLISWTFAYESNVFLSWVQSYENFRNQSNCEVCSKLPTSSTSDLPWWISSL